jgi:hypothetical protein
MRRIAATMQETGTRQAFVQALLDIIGGDESPINRSVSVFLLFTAACFAYLLLGFSSVYLPLYVFRWLASMLLGQAFKYLGGSELLLVSPQQFVNIYRLIRYLSSSFFHSRFFSSWF